jgi:hypothetical protein
MNSKQIFLFFLLFILALVVMTLPVWIDRALPIMNKNLNAGVLAFENAWAFLKFISSRLAHDFMGLLDKYVFGS